MAGEAGRSPYRLPADDDGPSVVDLADALWLARFLGRSSPAREPEAGSGAGAGAGAAGSTGPDTETGQPARTPGPRPQTPLHAVTAPTAAALQEPPGDAVPGPRGAGAAPVRVGRESVLTDPLAISRALRPLKQRAPGPGTPLLDEEATARASGESLMFLPAWKTPTERRFAVDLVVDTGPSMAMWQQLATELQTLFEAHGAFRVTDTWSLDTGAPRPRPEPFHRTSRGRPQRAFPPRQLADPTGRRLLLLLTDGVGPLWRSPELMEAVDRWSRTRPVAVLQVLPHSLWHRTALVPEHVLARSGAPGRATALFRPQTPHRRAARGPIRHQRWVPVLELRPDWLAPWARLVAGQAGDWIPMMALRAGAEPLPLPPLLPGSDHDPAAPDPAAADPAALVEGFRGEASAGAFELAGYLAAVPLVLPVMRLVQRAMMPRSGTAHLAEFFLSGLLVQVPDQPGSDSDPDLTLYEFRPGVREALLDTLTRRESLRVLDVVSRVSGRVARRLGGTLDFRALIPAPGSSEGWRLPQDSRPFARVAAKVLAGAGHEYKSVAEALAEAADGPTVRGRLTASPPTDRRDPVELISRLAAAATVRVHSAERVDGMVGSGFFVSPNRVLTSAHVLPAYSLHATGAGLHRVRIGYGDQLLSGVVEWAGLDNRPRTGSGPEPDLALIRVLDEVDHPCVWVTERPPGSVVLGGPTVCFGWSMVDGEARLHSFRCTNDGVFDGPDDERLLRLVGGPTILPGMSGGPVVDLGHGEVIGVLRGISGQNVRTAVPIQELRHLPVTVDPQEDLYQQLFTAHDLYHADRNSAAHEPGTTWTDVHTLLGRTTHIAGRTELLGMRRRAGGNASARRTSSDRTGPEVLLEIFPADDSGRHGWRIAIVWDDSEVTPMHADEEGAAPEALPGLLARPLAETLERCDRTGYAAPLQLALPSDLLPDLDVERWRLGARGGLMLGAERPIVTRLVGGPTAGGLAINEQRRTRWRFLHGGPPVPVILDGEVRTELQVLPPSAVPVLSGGGATSEVLHDLIVAGHPVVLWRRRPLAPGFLDAEFREGVNQLVGARSTEDLPAALASLRSRLVRGDVNAHWSDGLALLYDDPTSPLPGPGDGDLPEAP